MKKRVFLFIVSIVLIVLLTPLAVGAKNTKEDFYGEWFSDYSHPAGFDHHGDPVSERTSRQWIQICEDTIIIYTEGNNDSKRRFVVGDLIWRPISEEELDSVFDLSGTIKKIVSFGYNISGTVKNIIKDDFNSVAVDGKWIARLVLYKDDNRLRSDEDWYIGENDYIGPTNCDYDEFEDNIYINFDLIYSGASGIGVLVFVIILGRINHKLTN